MTRRTFVVLIAGCLILLVSMGNRNRFGLFVGPIAEDLFNNEVAVISLALAIQHLFWGLSQPMVGAIADKYGSGRTIAVSGLVYAWGLWLIANADSAWDLYTGAGLAVGFAGSGTTFAVILAVIARNTAPEKRSMIYGVATAMGTGGQITMAPISQTLIDQFGWSVAMMIMASLILLFVPLGLVMTGKAADVTEEGGGADSVTEAVNEARSHSGYLYLTAGFFVCGFQVFTVGVHLPNWLDTLGFEGLGAWALFTIGASNFFGTLTAGYLGGKYSKKRLLSGLYLMRSVFFTIFLLVPISPVSVIIFSAAIGFLWLGTVPLTNGIDGQVFGVKYLATLSGIVFASHQLGAFLGIYGAGLIFDRTGSYDLVWQIAIVLGVVAALLHMPINEAPLKRAPAPAE